MKLALSILFIVWSASLYSQALLDFDFKYFDHKKKDVFIVAGNNACDLCYGELIELIKKEQVDFNFLCISENDALLNRMTANKIKKKFKLNFDKIYFINKNELLLGNQSVFPKLMTIDEIMNISILSYLSIYNGEKLNKKVVKAFIK